MKINVYWRFANYLIMGQIYLLDSLLLREPLKLKHIKPRLPGHLATTPGLKLIYVNSNRLIKKFYLFNGPGPGGPGLVANTNIGRYIERVISEN